MGQARARIRTDADASNFDVLISQPLFTLPSGYQQQMPAMSAPPAGNCADNCNAETAHEVGSTTASSEDGGVAAGTSSNEEIGWDRYVDSTGRGWWYNNETEEFFFEDDSGLWQRWLYEDAD